MNKISVFLFSVSVSVCVFECNAQTVSGNVAGYDYVDLGLASGRLWATCNVGASKPTEYGDYFAWGETKPKEVYNWETYKWCMNKKTNEYGEPVDFTKYCTKSTYGTEDKKTVLEAEDDAATANWGAAWRMPTTEEQNELLDGCNWEWVEDFNGSGENGLLGTSKANGATIFLPAVGSRYDMALNFAGYSVDCWSSSLYEDIQNSAYRLYYFRDGNIKWHSSSLRSVGHCVRAVVK